MATLNEMSSMRKECETILSQPFTEYTSKYMAKVEDKADSKKAFQRMLRSIGEWNSSKVDREFSKFTKWCVKKDVLEEDIKNQLNQFVILSLRIMLSKKVRDEMIKDYQINLKDLFYKCMRRVARDLYERMLTRNTKESVKKGIRVGKKETNNIVVACLYEFIPLEKLIEIIELFKEENESTQSYDFNRTFSDSDCAKGKPLVLVEKEDSDESDTKDSEDTNESTSYKRYEPQLQYVPSENIEDDYFGFTEDENTDKLKKYNGDVKEIKLPKYKQKGYYKAKREPLTKPRVNEKDENFFSE